MAQYEFTADQNRTLEQLAKRMKSVAAFLFIFGGIIGIEVLRQALVGANFLFTAGMAAIYILMGIWVSRAGKSYQSIVQTEGRDIDHLMSATSSLLSLFNFQFWLFLISIILTVIGVLISVAFQSPTSLGT